MLTVEVAMGIIEDEKKLDKRIEALALESYIATGDAAVDADEWMTCLRDATKILNSG